MSHDLVGIPEGYAWPHLSYDPTSGIVVVELHSKSFGARFLPTRLFRRGSEQSEYRPLVDWDTRLSSESVVFVGDGIHAAFNSVKYSDIQDEHVSGDWNGIFLWDSHVDSVTPLTNSNTLKIPSGFTRAWPTNLLAIPADMKRVYCSLGLQREDGRAFYHVAAINVDTHAVELLTELKSTFY